MTKILLNYFEKPQSIIIFILSLLFLLIGTVLINFVFQNEIKIYDPRYLQLANNLYYKNSITIVWGVTDNPDKIMINPYNIQKGIYNNWFPIGYAIFIYLIMNLNEDYALILTIVQFLIFSFIPLIFYNLCLLVWRNDRKKFLYSFLATIIFIFNPYYMVSPFWKTDSWFNILFTISGFYLFLKLLQDPTFINSIFLILILGLTFFFRPIITFSFLIYFIIMCLIDRERKNLRKILSPVILSLTTIILLWGIRNFLLFGEFDFTNSSLGYNLWLGNNEYTNEYLKKYCGDGGAIEDYIIPKFDNKWKFLSNYSEYEKQDFFKNQAIHFIINNPFKTIENMFLKLLGFYSPFRVRNGHWSDSKIKNLAFMLHQVPIILLATITIFRLIFFKYRKDYLKYLLIFLICFTVPYLLFFSMYRFRAPIDFILIIFFVEALILIKNLIKLNIRKHNLLSEH
ncbi:MAG: hypothetical protein HPY57_09350 [Ignavibacteria bacterium]|nr:hypothetical protein [Ignavibacteria bacterium]